MKTNIRMAVLVLSLATISSVAGAVKGTDVASCATSELEARSAELMRLAFVRGQTAQVLIRGNGASDLDLEIRNGQGRLVCVSNGPSDTENCSVTSRTTGQYEVRINNRGNGRSRYQLCIS